MSFDQLDGNIHQKICEYLNLKDQINLQEALRHLGLNYQHSLKCPLTFWTMLEPVGLKCLVKVIDPATRRELSIGYFNSLSVELASKIRKDGLNCTLLTYSELGIRAQVVRLIELGANVNYQDQHGKTALMAASYTGQYKIVQLLLKAGANPYLGDYYSENALFYAAHWESWKVHAIKQYFSLYRIDHVQTAQILLESGLSADDKNYHGKTPIDYAIARKHSEVVDVLENSKRLRIN